MQPRAVRQHRVDERGREVVSVDLTGHRAARPRVEAQRPGLDRNGAGPWTPFHDNPPGNTKPRSGLLAAAESTISAEMQTANALIAIGHAILATVNPRHVRARRVAPGLPPTGGSPRQRWLSGEDYTDKEK